LALTFWSTLASQIDVKAFKIAPRGPAELREIMEASLASQHLRIVPDPFDFVPRILVPAARIVAQLLRAA